VLTQSQRRSKLHLHNRCCSYNFLFGLEPKLPACAGVLLTPSEYANVLWNAVGHALSRTDSCYKHEGPSWHLIKRASQAFTREYPVGYLIFS
jgi:hypothetical protein